MSSPSTASHACKPQTLITRFRASGPGLVTSKQYPRTCSNACLNLQQTRKLKAAMALLGQAAGLTRIPGLPCTCALETWDQDPGPAILKTTFLNPWCVLGLSLRQQMKTRLAQPKRQTLNCSALGGQANLPHLKQSAWWV